MTLRAIVSSGNLALRREEEEERGEGGDGWSRWREEVEKRRE